VDNEVSINGPPKTQRDGRRLTRLSAERRELGSWELFWLLDGRWPGRRPLKLTLGNVIEL
jgi:hypothetical protein